LGVLEIVGLIALSRTARLSLDAFGIEAGKAARAAYNHGRVQSS
jgi:hypothetical protein